jgi:hypothetical protein
MANAGRPTPQSRHIKVKYYTLQEWVEQDLVVLQGIDITINMADGGPTRNLFYCYCHRRH